MPGLIAKIRPTAGFSGNAYCGVWPGAEHSAALVFLVPGRRLGSASTIRGLSFLDDTSHFSGNKERARDTD